MRQRLTQLLSKMEGNDKLEQLLADVLATPRKRWRSLGFRVQVRASAQSDASDSQPQPEETQS